MARKPFALAMAAVALAAAGSALAQSEPDTAALCGGLGAQGAWIGGDAGAADLAALGAPVDLGADLPRDAAWIGLFRLGTGSAVRLEAQPRAGGDTEIELYAADGTVIARDDDGGGGLASRLDVQLEPGNYCMLTRGLGGSAVSADIRLGLANHPALTAGSGAAGACTPRTAAAPLGDGPLSAALDGGVTASASAGETPFYRFTLAEPTALTLLAENERADPVLSLYDATGALLDSNDDADGLNSRIVKRTPLPAGTYCIAVEALSDAGVPITVTLRRFDEQAELMRMYARGEASPPPGGPVPIVDLGALGGLTVRDALIGDDTQWFSFASMGGDLALIRAVGMAGADPVLVLFDGFGTEIDRNDDSRGSLDATIAARLAPGSYMIGVSKLGDDAPAAIRLSVQRFVPAE